MDPTVEVSTLSESLYLSGKDTISPNSPITAIESYSPFFIDFVLWASSSCRIVSNTRLT